MRAPCLGFPSKDDSACANPDYTGNVKVKVRLTAKVRLRSESKVQERIQVPQAVIHFVFVLVLVLQLIDTKCTVPTFSTRLIVVPVYSHFVMLTANMPDKFAMLL